jgi:hypothetical protein
MPGHGGRPEQAWPTADAFAAAVQMPRLSFTNPELKASRCALNSLGLPVVMSGNFAYVFKFGLVNGQARAVRCFRQHLGDRAERYAAIAKHLSEKSVKATAGFEYAAGGIMVNGYRYPILVMEWIEGNTLDVHIGEVLKHSTGKSSLTSLAREWIQVMDDLMRAGVAHGDIQHGNIMVTGRGLRLVDLDGMFVPSLAGRRSTEVGHMHFQHPKRTGSNFDASVDHFPSLIVYLSLLALAEDPALWRKYHDDNLLFTKADFLAPQRSQLIASLRSRNGDVRHITEVVVKALTGPLGDVPPLNSLVKQSKLPAWISDPIVPTVPTRTLEARPAALPSPERGHGLGVRCTTCNSYLITDAPTCHLCGGDLQRRSSQQSALPRTSIQCPSCRSILYTTSSQCTNCGAALKPAHLASSPSAPKKKGKKSRTSPHAPPAQAAPPSPHAVPMHIRCQFVYPNGMQCTNSLPTPSAGGICHQHVSYRTPNSSWSCYPSTPFPPGVTPSVPTQSHPVPAQPSSSGPAAHSASVGQCTWTYNGGLVCSNPRAARSSYYCEEHLRNGSAYAGPSPPNAVSGLPQAPSSLHIAGPSPTVTFSSTQTPGFSTGPPTGPSSGSNPTTAGLAVPGTGTNAVAADIVWVQSTCLQIEKACAFMAVALTVLGAVAAGIVGAQGGVIVALIGAIVGGCACWFIGLWLFGGLAAALQAPLKWYCNLSGLFRVLVVIGCLSATIGACYLWLIALPRW